MNMARQKSWLLLFAALLSMNSFGTMQIEFYEHHHENHFQLVGQGNVDFDGSSTNTFVTPVINGSISPPPECEEGQTYAWYAYDLDEEEDEGVSFTDTPALKLRRGGQPVNEFFTLLRHMTGQFARYVQKAPDPESAGFSLFDGKWDGEDWAETVPPDHYQLNGSNHLPLSRLIHSLLTGGSIVQYEGRDVFDDIFYTSHDASIWLCIVAGTNRSKVKVHIKTPTNEFVAILELPLAAYRRSSSPMLVRDPGHSPKKGRRQNTSKQSPLLKSHRSAPLLPSSFFSSGKTTAPFYEAETAINAFSGFTPYMAFLIIRSLKTQKYNQ